MKTIEAYNYKIGLDVSSLQGGGIITRRELGQLRRDIGSLQDPVERSAAKLDRLKNALNRGVIDSAQYAEAVRRIKDGFPETIAAKKELLETDRQASAIRQSLMTDEQKYREEVKRTAAIVKAGKLTHEEAKEHLRRYRETMPDAIAQQRRLADAQRDAARIQRESMSDAQRYREEVLRVKAAVRDGGLSHADAKRHLDEYRASLPAAAAAEQARVAAMQRGEAMTQRYMRSTERLAREIREINSLERAGSIDQRTASLARRDARRTATAGRIAEFAGVPGMGQVGAFAGQAGQLMAMAGPLAAVAGGVIAVTAAYRAGHAAVAAFTGAMKEDAAAMSAAYHSANLLQTSVESLIGFQYMVAQTNGMTGEQANGLIERMSVNLADAAAGTGKAKAVIDQLGLDAKALSLKDPADAMKILFDRVSELQNPVEQARVAVRLFGRDGIAMAELMRKGATEIQAYENRARELGLVISNVDAAGITAAGDAMTDVGNVLTGVVRQFNTGFYPAVTAISGELIAWLTPLTKSRDVGEVIGATIVEIVGATIDATSAAIAFHRVLWNIATFDFSEVAEQFDSFGNHLGGSTTKNMRDRFTEARREAARLAEDMNRNAEINRLAMAGESDRPDVGVTSGLDINKEIESLRERNLELAKGAEWVQEFKILQSGAPEELRAEYRELVKRNAELERGKKISEQTDTLAKQVAIARETEAIKNQTGITDEQHARQLAELRIQGATNQQLEETVRLQGQLTAIERQKQDQAARVAATKQLEQDATRIRDSLRSPEQSLELDLQRLNEMFRAGLLAANEYAAAKARAVRELIAVPDQLATKATTFGDGSDIYAARVEDQNRREKQAIEDAEAKRLLGNINALAQADQQRLNTQRQITEQMRQQAIAAGQMQRPGANGPAGQTVAGEGMDDSQLERIADAAERTAAAISNWQIIGV